MFVGHQREYLEYAKEYFSLNNEIVVYQGTYLKGNILPVSNNDMEIRVLDINYFDSVKKYYSSVVEDDYLSSRLKSGEFYGAFLDQQLTGFIGLHDEHSIGFLEVLPQFKRRGIAYNLELFIIKDLLDGGDIPYAQVTITNNASLKLHEKLGYEFSNQIITWLM